MSLSIICFLLLLSFTSAGSLGMSPSSFKFDFRPNLEENVVIRVADSDSNQLIKVFVEGDLKEYVTINQESFVGAGTLEVIIKLPAALSKPGRHRILIGSVESKEMTVSGSIGGVSAIQVPIDIIVPYPGKYAEAEFSVSDVNQGEDINYHAVISNLGTQSLNLSYELSIFEESSMQLVIPKVKNYAFLETKEKLDVKDIINGSNIKQGNYIGFFEVDYEDRIILNDSFRVGTFFMNITDYDYKFVAGKINKFTVYTKSFWNSPIKEAYLEVSVTDGGVMKDEFKTQIYSFQPWEEKKMEGYIDATNITEGRYVGNLFLYYDGKVTNKLVALYFEKQQLSRTEKLLYGALGIIVLFIMITIILVVKIFFIRRKNGKEK